MCLDPQKTVFACFTPSVVSSRKLPDPFFYAIDFLFFFAPFILISSCCLAFTKISEVASFPLIASFYSTLTAACFSSTLAAACFSGCTLIDFSPLPTEQKLSYEDLSQSSKEPLSNGSPSDPRLASVPNNWS